jgi:hypothetical protein
MADGDQLILGNDNDAESQTSLKTELSNGTSGLYGLHVQALKGNAMGGLSRDGFGIEGISTSLAGVAGTSTNDDGVFGSSSNGSGAHGTSINGTGVRGTSFQSSGVEGFSYGPGAGITGIAPYQTAPGVVGISGNSFGVRGQSGAADLLPPVGGGAEFQKCAVQGSSDEGTGVRGDSAHRVGVRGRSFSADGVFGSCSDQPGGSKTHGNGIHGQAPRSSPDAKMGPFAGKFDGDVTISGNLYVGDRLIAYASLRHSQIVLSAGLVDLDSKGEAVVALPEGLGDLHKDFRYQLTPVGGPAPNLHVAQEIHGDQFKIAGGAPKIKVSWQIAGEPMADRRVPLEHTAEEPFDEKLAQEFKLHLHNFTRLVEELKDRLQR